MIKKLIKITSRYLQNVSVVKRYVYLDNKHINEVILADDVEGWGSFLKRMLTIN